ncbi:DUF262 domain-containing protein [Brevibacillus parabrevis]|uniref:DUF262 domain-containing protein n=1 Tax=Brevibacillus parabrevis TaxID=54914 RepID=UPI002E2095BD|nr:DUF262 domain-containing protein [Brevibacillus parabrevis]
MANWETKKVSEIVTRIHDNTLVLPVIQRRLVWEEEKMELLFDTLLKGNSFGGIMAIEEEEGNKPLFAYRHFTKDGQAISSIYDETNSKDHLFIIDGQQRLQSFYLGLLGSFNGKILYFDLFSDFKNLVFYFKFEKDSDKLPKQATDKEECELKTYKWYSVSKLYRSLKQTNDEDQVADEIIQNFAITEALEKDYVRKNIARFYRSIFNNESIGLSKVRINRSLNENSNRQRIVELFRRLNDGGTKLSSFDLVASILKGFEWKMEEFLESTLKDYQDIGLTQEVLIKLVFLLNDNHKKEMTDIEEADATFAIENRARILETLKSLRKFLQSAKLLNYYREGNRSFIPLYFIAYHIFHKTDVPTDRLENMFDTFDTSNEDFASIYEWMYWSLLNGVFSRGSGWIPYKTGIRKILEEMKQHKNAPFPTQRLFSIYTSHPLWFTRNLDESSISNQFDSNFLFYLIYDREPVTRKQDMDHIHPYSILVSKGYSLDQINSVFNYQLLDYGTNRGVKNAKPLKEWIDNHVTNKTFYINQHLIPDDVQTWDADQFLLFYEQRAQLIKEKLHPMLYI